MIWILSTDEKGDIIIQTLNSSDQVLNQVSVVSSFLYRTLAAPGTPSPATTIDLGAMPIVVALPDNDQIATVLIKRSNGVVIAKLAANYSVAQLIDDIPLAAFQFFPKFAKQLLLDEAKNADAAIKNGKKQEAKLLIEALITEIQIGTKDFKISATTQLSKTDILKMLIQILKGL